MAATFVELLRWRAHHQPNRVAYSFIEDGDAAEVQLTYGELDRRARAIGALLQSLGASGERAVLLYPPSLDYLAAFFGCLYANVVAVPAYPPRVNRLLSRTQAIATDAQAYVALTTTHILSGLEGQLAATPALENLRWEATDNLPCGLEGDWRESLPGRDTLAFLQYTSGSTGTPKGVMVSHGNLMHNSAMLAHAFGYDDATECVTWLPLYHDMGLIGGVLQPLHGGFPNTLMSPLSFLRNPLHWLEVISRKKATLSGGPNFAYELCLRKASAGQLANAEQLAQLNLSHWRVAFTGAEPVRPDTLERFANAFAPYGFDRKSFFPCYGLAEATLIVSGGHRDDPPVIQRVSRRALMQNRVQEAGFEEHNSQAVVGCGSLLPEHEVLIADPDAMTPCPADTVGEVWVSGPSVTQGYWNRPEELEPTFKARLAETNRGPFLRTGDLGYLREGQLFITGRLKDLIIIRGRNYYPQDIELTVERSHASLRAGCGAAFSVEVGSEERLVVVQEIASTQQDGTEAIIEAIRRAVAEEHELQVHAVALIKPKSIPKTSSGKIQRRACRQDYLNGNLKAIKISDLNSEHEREEAEANLSRAELEAAAPELRAQLLKTYLQKQLARVLGVNVSALDWEKPLSSFGLDSLMAVELQSAIESEMHVLLPMTSFLQDTSIGQLASQVLDELSVETPLQQVGLNVKRDAAVEYPLSPGQRGLWFLYELSPESVAYNIVRAVRVRSELDATALRRAFQTLVARHASLRTTFATVDGEPVQRIKEHAEVHFVEEDATAWNEAGMNARLAEEAQRPCDLEQGPVLRVNLFKRSALEHILVLVVHHIAVDFWSLAVLLQELSEYYLAEHNGDVKSLPAPSFEYADFVEAQLEMLNGPAGERLWNYWQRQLTGELPVLDLPLDRPRPPLQTYNGASQLMRLDAELTDRLKALGKSRGATLYMTLLAAFALLLKRYAGQDDLLIGSPTNGRSRTELMNMVGYFVNTVLMRADLSGNPSFEVLLERTRRLVLEALEHQQYPFTQLVERLQPVRDPSRSPLFQAMFVLQKAQVMDEQGLTSFMLGESGERMRCGDMIWETLALDNQVAKFDLTLMMAEVNGELSASLEYNTDLFDAATIQQMLVHFRSLLKNIVLQPASLVGELELMTPEEFQQVVIEWNQTETDYPHDKCIHQLFEQQVSLTPDALALSFQDQHLSYAQLNARANQLAHYLRSLGVGPEVLVGICVERSPEMIVGLLAVLKAGGAYLPLDPSYPQERLSFMLDDAQVRVLLTQGSLLSVLPGRAMKVLCLDSDCAEMSGLSEDNLSVEATVENLAYVIYTSGSTGRPKGVMIQHQGLVNYLSWCTKEYALADGSGAPVHSPIGFDLTVTSLFAPLLAGRSVALIAEHEGIEGLSAALLRRDDFSLVKLTPSHLELLCQMMPSEEVAELTRAFIIGGEALLGNTLAFWQQYASGTRLINEYGPTETVVGCCTYEVPGGKISAGAVPIGRPIANTQIYVLDQYLKPVPTGVLGEIYIGGDGLSRGYVNQPALTAAKFVPDPFGKEPGARLYRTGDKARHLRDGNIEYLGRFDDQVKLRGYRIELNEIEAVLAEYPAVREAVVVVREDEPGDKRLVAYLAVEPLSEPSLTDLRAYLKERLPVYMMPAGFVMLESLPLTPNGKIDRRALPTPEQTGAEADEKSAMPLTPVEEMLAGIWSEVLRVAQVGAGDDFFSLGGHSLLATRLVSRIRDLFHVEVALHQVFAARTLREMGEVVEKLLKAEQGSDLPPLERTVGEWELPLSFAQQRLWLLDQLEPGNPFYNIPFVMRLEGALDIAVLERTLSEIIRRHEALRTRFVLVDGPPRQLITPPQALRIEVRDLSRMAASEREAEARHIASEHARLSFDLALGPLLRVELLRLDEQEHMLLLTLHHIVSDGWSMSVLLQEIATLYSAFLNNEASPLPELPVQYSDFAIWQRKWLQGEVLERQLSYWKQQLAGPLPVLELSTDHPRPPVQTFRGALESIELSTELTGALKELSQREKVTLYMTLLAAFQVLLSRYTGQDEVIVGSPVANRNLVETESLIGFFVNTLVLRTNLSGAPSFAEALHRVREVCLGAYAHQDIPFERLVEELQPDRDISRSIFFQVMFVLQNAPQVELKLPGLTWSNVSIDSETAKFDLLLSMRETGDALIGTLQYNTDLFEATTIRRMLDHFQTLLESLTSHPSSSINTLPLMTARERHQLLVEWNQTATPYPYDRCVHQIFEEQVERTPEAVALIFDDEQLTYRQLNHRANQLARFILSRSLHADAPLPLCLDRGTLPIISLLAALKAGHPYLPLDPAHPAPHLRFILDDANAPFFFTHTSLLNRFPQLSDRALCLDLLDAQLDSFSNENLSLPLSSDRLAYLIYTSGSTGRPKGVMIQHASVLNLRGALYEAVYHRYGRELRVSLNAPLAFDSSVKQLVQLLDGHTLCVIGEEVRRDAELMVEVLAGQGVEVLDCTPSQLRLLRSAGLEERLRGQLKAVLVGGEEVDAGLWQEMRESEWVDYYNVYGPTECTVDTTVSRVRESEWEQGSIGRAIGNTEVYILDGGGEAVPVGVGGELHIGGAGLARGYWSRAELTAEKFIPHPYSREAGARLYRTGDLARYLSNGEVQFLGRIDEQVKVRGYRIELGEIETVLMQHPSLRECVVIAREDVPGEKRLVAYVVIEAEQRGQLGSVGELRRYAKERLPEYMVPSQVVEMEHIPLTGNGKVDKRGLPLVELRVESEGEHVGERTPVEELLVGVYEQVLSLEGVGVHDNFFDLGGHSLLATRLVSRLREVFEIEVTLRSLFESPTITALAEVIDAALRDDKQSEGPPLLPVARDDEEEALPLSFAQQRLWFLDQLEPGNPFYNIPIAVRLTGQLNIPALEQTLSEIIRRHESLRTSFVIVNDEPVQVIAPAQPLHFVVEDLRGLAAEEREKEAVRLASEEARRPFDLSSGPLLRMRLLRLDEETHVVALTMHHIISDGWSMGVFVREVAALYTAYSTGQEVMLSELPIRYADFAHWQREWLQGEILDQQMTYWKKQLGGPLPVLVLPTDRPRPPVQSYSGAQQSFFLPPDLTEALKELSRREGTTLFMTLLAAYQTLLYRYTGQDDVIVGTAIAGRNRAEIELLIGFFVNTLVLRTDLSGNPGFTDVLRKVREVCLGAYAHQDLPFEKLVEELHPERDLSRSPLFQTMFLLQNFPMEKLALSLPNLELSPMKIDNGSAKLDLLINITEETEGICWTWIYNTDLFDAATIRRMSNHMQVMMEAIVADPQQRVAAYALMSERESQQALVEWNDTAREFHLDRCIHEVFEEQAGRAPFAKAVVYEDESLTYAELNTRANQLGHYLRSLGVGPEMLVGVCVERSLEMMVALLGILKAGGTYLPLDPTYPTERLAFMLKDARARVLLTQQRLLKSLPEHEAEVVCLDSNWEAIAVQSTENPASDVSADNLAYVIYTSGSTGKPKGVTICHRSVINLMEAIYPRVCNNEQDVWTLVHSYAFDFSVWELWGALLSGGRLVIVPFWVTRTPAALEKLLCEEGVTIFNQTPSAFAQLIGDREKAAVETDEFTLKSIILGGEALPQELGNKMLGGKLNVWNFYGPTEATVWTTIQPVQNSETATCIGHPIANVQVYILDKQHQIVPVGVGGELHIGGAGLARGYWNRAELTAEKFIPHPYSREAGARLYRTGDLARYLSNGEVQFLGRIDEQVKVRGYRIELGEIESVLMQHPALRECVVIAREDVPGEKRLVAYVVIEAEQRGQLGSVGELRRYAKERLPEYMVPSQVVEMEHIPLTGNGKVDKRGLPLVELRVESEGEHVGGRTPVEELLVGVYEQVLSLEGVGVHDNFFDLGGHSLLATQVVSRLRDLFQVDIPLRSLFESPTVAGLSRSIEALLHVDRECEAPPLLPLARDDEEEALPLSFAQQRMWFLNQFEPDSPFYNISVALRLDGPLNFAALEQSFREIARRHETLRTTFPTVDGVAVQLVAATSDVSLPLLDLSELAEAERETEALRIATEEARRPFDLTRGPMMRSTLLRLSEAEHVVALTMHHIISDGWSMGVFVREVAALYEAYSTGQPSPLPDLTIQYPDFANWQRQWLRDEVLEGQLAYWKRQLTDLPTLQFPTSRPRPDVQSFRGARRSMLLPESLSHALDELRRREGVTLFMTLLAAFQVLLHHYTGQPDIVVGTDISNRTRSETEGLIGFFANQLVLRTDLSDGPSFKELLARVRDIALEAYAHQDLPFDMLVKALKLKRDADRTPLFQAKIVLQNAPLTNLELPGLTFHPLEIDGGTAKFDLLLTINEQEHGLFCLLEYNTDIFDSGAMLRLLERYEVLLNAVVEQPEASLSGLRETIVEADKRYLAAKQKTHRETRFRKLRELNLEEMRIEK